MALVDTDIEDVRGNAQSEGYVRGRFEAALSAIAIIAKETPEAANSEVDDFSIKVMRRIAEAELS